MAHADIAISFFLLFPSCTERRAIFALSASRASALVPEMRRGTEDNFMRMFIQYQ